MRPSPATAPLGRMKKARGFTLIELLVAISIMAIVAVLGWRGLDSIVRAREALTAELEQVRGLQLAFAQMQSDCAHIVDTEQLPDRARLVVEPQRVVLVRTVFADDQPSRIQVIAYHLINGVLTRRESLPTRDLNELDSLWQSVADATAASRAVVLQRGVAAMKTRVWINDGKGWRRPTDNAAATGTTRPAPAGAPVAPAGPTGLEVALQLEDRPSDMVKVFLLGAI